MVKPSARIDLLRCANWCLFTRQRCCQRYSAFNAQNTQRKLSKLTVDTGIRWPILKTNIN